MKQIATIYPGEAAPGQACPTRLTRVVLADGTELSGVTDITLIARVNDVWRARIECFVRPMPITAEFEVTDLGDDACRFEAPPPEDTEARPA